MKKYLYLTVCLILLFTLTACQGNNGQQNASAPTVDTMQNVTENTQATESVGATETTKVTEPTGAMENPEATEPVPTEEATAPTQESIPGNTETTPKPTNPQPTEPKPTNPTQSTAQPTMPPDPNAIDQGIGLGSGDFTWKLTKDGTLTISGNSRPENMQTYPWTQYADQVKKVVVEDGITHIPSYAFMLFEQLTEVVLSDSVTTIASYAFSNCVSLTEVTIPPKVTELVTDTFVGCIKLEKVRFTSDTQLHTIHAGAFGASGLQEFIAPSSLRVIKTKAFANLDHLKTVVLNEGLETIEPKAFEACRLLEKLVIDAGTVKIGNYAFYNCVAIRYYESHNSSNIPLNNLTGLETVIIDGNTTGLPSFAGCTSLKNLTVKSPVTAIGSMDFINCKALTEWSIPETIQEIGNHAFVNSGIQKITISASVKKLGICLFNKTTLQEIIFTGDPPEFVSTITDGVFSGLEKVTAYYPADNPAWTEAVRQNYGAAEVIWIAK